MESNRPAAITRQHLTGRAAVYVRQSTLEQTRTNTGSTEYQRSQSRWALAWGYRPDQIDLIDDDLGLSGSAAGHRSGYLRLREGVRNGVYKLILVSDLTRLGRDADEAFDFIRDCKHHGVLIAIDGDVLDARHKYDLLRARLSAMFAELDRDNIRDTFERGRRARLQQGRAVSKAPAGYRARAGRWEIDPRLEVQAPIRACVDLFLEYRAVPRTVAALRARDISLPRARPGGDVEFVPATVHAVLAILKNPAYKGEYHWGRYRSDPAAGRDRRGRVRLRRANPDDVVVIKGHHDAYVSEEVWDEVQRVLKENTWTPSHAGMGKGGATLQGIVRCERCGFSMAVAYKAQRQNGRWTHRYQCIGELFEGGKPCSSVPGKAFDAAVEREILARITPVPVDAVAAAYRAHGDAESAEEHRRKLELHRRRAHVADLDFRYLHVDPKNTYVHRALEDRLEDAKRKLERLEADGTALPSWPSLTDEDLRELADLAAKVERIFYAATTSNRDRKEIVRMMVARVVVEDRSDEIVRVRIEWADGSPDTRIEVYMIRYAQRLIWELSQTGLSASDIAARLNDQGLRTKYQTVWTEKNVTRALNRMLAKERARPSPGPTARREDREQEQPAPR